MMKNVTEDFTQMEFTVERNTIESSIRQKQLATTLVIYG